MNEEEVEEVAVPPPPEPVWYGAFNKSSGEMTDLQRNTASIDKIQGLFPLQEVRILPDNGWYYLNTAGALVALPIRPQGAVGFDKVKGAWIVDPNLVLAHTRAKRDALMAESDWVSLRAMETGEPVPKAWLEYRQALRDITETGVWPTKPSD